MLDVFTWPFFSFCLLVFYSLTVLIREIPISERTVIDLSGGSRMDKNSVDNLDSKFFFY